MIIVLGLPGTGKTTFAIALAQALNASHLNSDLVRHETGQRGKYDPKTKANIYQLLLNQTIKLLDQGQNVVVDATFSKQDWRSKFVEACTRQRLLISWMVIEAEEEVIRKRVSKKRVYSEADFDVYLKIKKEYDLVQPPFLTLHSDLETLQNMVDKALAYLQNIENSTGK